MSKADTNPVVLLSVTSTGVHSGIKMESKEKRVVLICMDGSSLAEHTFHWYVEKLHEPENSLIIAHCMDYSNFSAVLMVPGAPQLASKIVHDEEERVHTQMQKFKHLMQAAGLDGKIMRLIGDPGEAIIKAADDVHAHMIVCGSRGQGTVRRTLLGSVSSYIIHHSHVPVLICRHDSIL